MPADTETIERKLIKQLENTKAGKLGWVEYENITYSILQYLFCTYQDSEMSLNQFYDIAKIDEKDTFLFQDRTQHGFEIRDIIMPNFATKGFWKYIGEKYKGDLIVVDCKNYTEAIKKHEILTVANYINEKGCGLFALICTRVEISDSARNAVKNQWIHANKMILCLTDNDLIQMLGDKERGVDPANTIKTKLYAFRKDID